MAAFHSVRPLCVPPLFVIKRPPKVNSRFFFETTYASCGNKHFRNKRNLWQTGRTLIPLTTTIVDVQTQQVLIYLSNFVYYYVP